MKGTRRRPLLGLLVLVALLVTVAAASTGSVPVGAGGVRRPSDRLLDILISLFAIWMAFGVLLWGYLLLLRRDVLAEAAAARRRRSPWASVIGFAVAFGVLALIVRWLSVDDALRRRIAAQVQPWSAGARDAGRQDAER